ncbi:HipA family kinase [Delftia sp. WSY_4]|uniref:HipA family kinase n=1 Tax=unclassified Delftia TaxID=2613839 RepID=UPI00370C474A
MPPAIAEVIEIQGRSEQGAQKPFLCRADDGQTYYVKGRQTDRSSLCNEWICAHLAVQLGLPLPPFKLLHVSQELLDEAPRPWRELGCGIAFGSQRHPGCTWFDKAQILHVPQDLQASILAFDWWVQNVDRMDGNSNLLWDAHRSALVVIDHNLAFDPHLDAATFIENHIFRGCWQKTDLVSRDRLQDQLSEAMDAVFRFACDNIPPEWHWNNPECDIPARVDINAIAATLAKCKSPDFWRFT